MASDPGGRRAAIEAALLDFHRAPGKHALIGRQPAVLFASIKEVLQLASGRSPEGDETAPPSASVRRAACHFIRSAMLYPDADHYALLSLDRTTDPAAVKDRYRLMMRLVHPDFANALSGAEWPADAATRLNRAYEVLSSPVRRRAYDEQLAAPAPTRPSYAEHRSGSARVSPPMKVAATVPPYDPRRHLKRLATLFGAAGGIAVVAAWLASGQPAMDMLVQRPAPPRPPDMAPPSPAAAEVVAVIPVEAPASTPATTPASTTVPIVAEPPVTEPPPAPALMAVPASVPVPVPAPRRQPPPPETVLASAPAAAPVPVPVPVPAPAPVTRSLARAAPLPPMVDSPSSPLPAPMPVAAQLPPSSGPTLAEVHPLLTHLIQQLESGWGDRVIGLLDRESRATPGAQALLEKYNQTVEGMRPVRLSSAHFTTAESRDGRLVVVGRVSVQVRDRSLPPKELVLQAEFTARHGTAVLTRLAPGRD
jgi:hypothetical protein